MFLYLSCLSSISFARFSFSFQRLYINNAPFSNFMFSSMLSHGDWFYNKLSCAVAICQIIISVPNVPFISSSENTAGPFKYLYFVGCHNFELYQKLPVEQQRKNGYLTSRVLSGQVPAMKFLWHSVALVNGFFRTSSCSGRQPAVELSKILHSFVKSSNIWHLLLVSLLQNQRGPISSNFCKDGSSDPFGIWYQESKALPFLLRSGSPLWGILVERLFHVCSSPIWV